MTELPSGTVTFLFTDIEGSTQLLHRLGGSYDEVLAEHERILQSAFDAHGGRVVDTQGDSLFAAFRRAKDAVAAAAAAQRDLAAYAWPEGTAVRVRMGLHTGEPRIGGERYVGMGVHKAARIGAAGHGGQVLLSRTTRELVEDELPAGVTIRDLGERRLKDLDTPERLSQLVIEGLPGQFGALKTLDVELKRKRRWIYAGAAVIGLLAVAVAILVLGLGSGGGVSVEPDAVAVIDPSSNEVVDSVPVGVSPAAVAVGEGSVWVANTEDATVSRIDARTRRVLRTIPVDGHPSDVAVDYGSTWVLLSGAPAQLQRIVPELSEAESPSPAVVSTGGCSHSDAALSAGGGALWVACRQISGSDAARVDAQTRQVVRIDEALFSSSPVGIELSDIAFGLGSVWITNRVGNAVVQIEPATLRNVREVQVGRAPAALTAAFGSVWVANADEDTVSRFQPSEIDQPVVVESIPVGDTPVDVAVGDDAVWVVDRGDRTISRIDPSTNEVVATIELEHEPVRIAAGDGLAWVTVQEAS